VTATVRQLKKRPAKQPERRFVTFVLTGDYEGWEGAARADFKIKIVADLDSGQMDRVIPALDSIVTDHNFPDADDPDKIAATIGDVDSDAIGPIVDAIFTAIGKLPNR
jgi:hypothetical protein